MIRAGSGLPFLNPFIIILALASNSALLPVLAQGKLILKLLIADKR